MSVEEYIAKGVHWVDLPTNIQAILNRDENEYSARILVYFLQNQLEYSGELITKVIRSEKGYYKQLIHYSSQQLMLFPYHLQRKIVAGLKITPFVYYRLIVQRTMMSEYSYDRIPNFTAADCFQVLGIGRNEYIDLLNNYKGIICSPLTNSFDAPVMALDKLLPKFPLDCKTLEPWFIVRAGSISINDIDCNSVEEQRILDRIIDQDSIDASHEGEATQTVYGVRVSDVPIKIVQQLYRRGLIYFDVPIMDFDCISVPTLDGFIMNRITGDSCETMLYKIFVSLDPRSCIHQLATDLGVRVEFVINAASIFCRLGFANKVERKSLTSLEENTLKDSLNKSVAYTSLQLASTGISESYEKKIAFIFDSTITAYLMLGNLSADLKKHSVTMFEVGKLTGDSIDAFYRQLNAVSHCSEHDVSIYYEHARCLGQTMRHISQASVTEENREHDNFNCLDLIRCGSLGSLEPATRRRILLKNYKLLVFMAPISYEEAQVLGGDWPITIGPPMAEASSPWFRFFITNAAGSGSGIKSASCGMPALMLCRGCRLNFLPEPLAAFSRFLVTSWGHDSVLMDTCTLFTSVNDLILNSPVLIQAYDDQEESTPLHQHFLPLPLSSSFLKKNAPQLNWLKHLSQNLDLTALIGFLTILLPAEETQDWESTGGVLAGFDGGANASSHFLENSILEPRAVLTESAFSNLVSSGHSVCLLTLSLGIPLFNAALNDALFSRLSSLSSISSNKGESKKDEDVTLLTDVHRNRLAKANADLQTRLKEFIMQVGGIFVSDDTSPGKTWALPTKSYYWSDGCLTEWIN